MLLLLINRKLLKLLDILYFRYFLENQTYPDTNHFFIQLVARRFDIPSYQCRRIKIHPVVYRKHYCISIILKQNGGEDCGGHGTHCTVPELSAALPTGLLLRASLSNLCVSCLASELDQPQILSTVGLY